MVIHGKGSSGLLLPLFANGWNVIIPKHIAEKDPVNALKTTVIGTGPFRLKEPPTSSLWKYERNPDILRKICPSSMRSRSTSSLTPRPWWRRS